MTRKIIIAIDGYSSSGKSTMAKRLAREIGYVYVDSGAMYRAVTLCALEHGMVAADGTVDVAALNAVLPSLDIGFRIDSASGASVTYLNGRNVEREIRTLRVSGAVSPVAAVPEVRTVLTQLQQKLGEERGIVMDGRDIGTTVFPDAEMKIFVEASPAVRARRRYKELLDKGMEVTYDDVYANILKRDEIDVSRPVSPLRKADDAIVLNNDALSPGQQFERLMEIFREKTAEK